MSSVYVHIKLFYLKFLHNRYVHHTLVVTHEVMVAVAVEERARIMMMSGIIIVAIAILTWAAIVGKDL